MLCCLAENLCVYKCFQQRGKFNNSLTKFRDRYLTVSLKGFASSFLFFWHLLFRLIARCLVGFKYLHWFISLALNLRRKRRHLVILLSALKSKLLGVLLGKDKVRVHECNARVYHTTVKPVKGVHANRSKHWHVRHEKVLLGCEISSRTNINVSGSNARNPILRFW